MRNSNRGLIFMLWAVIAVLILGGGVIGFMLFNKTEELNQTNNELTGNNLSLREQLRQAKATPRVTPTPTPTPTPSPTASASPRP